MSIRHAIKALFVLAVTLFTVSSVNAQDCADFTAFPGGADEGKKVHVLYRDLIEKEQYEEAFPMWQQLMENSPGGHVYHFIDGVTLYTSFIERDSEDGEKVAAHKQTIVDLFEQRMACLSEKRNDKGSVLETMAYTMTDIEYEDDAKILATYEAAVELNGNKTSAYILAYYASHAINMFGNDALSKDKIRDLYVSLGEIKDANAEDSDYSDNWTYVEEYYEPYIDHIFDCAYFMEKEKVKYAADPDNHEVFRPILKKLLGKGCSVEDPFMAELIKKDEAQGAVERAAAMERWKTEEPDNYGNELIRKGNYEEALPYLQKSLSMPIGSERLSKANYSLAKYYHKKGQYGKARGYYNAAASNRPGWGKPYIEIGKMYASSVRSCGNNDSFQQGVVVCAALDMWGKAKSVDSSVAGEANNLIGKYSGSVPTKEDAFQRGVSAGQSASVGCWIGGSASIRLRSQY